MKNILLLIIGMLLVSCSNIPLSNPKKMYVQDTKGVIYKATQVTEDSFRLEKVDIRKLDIIELFKGVE